jgi:mRNA-degrading endonuclease HigB of HigAB toxin-antitoxin module
MNTFEVIDTDYIRSSRSIEAVLVSNSKLNQVFYVFNYEGYSYRVFGSILSLINFFQCDSESDFHFDTESELDDFFSKVELIQ